MRQKKSGEINFEEYFSELSGGRSRSSSFKPLKPDWNLDEGACRPTLLKAPSVARGGVSRIAPSNLVAHPAGFEPATCELEVRRAIHCATGVDSELVASRGVNETPAASIGDLVGKIVQRLEILFGAPMVMDARPQGKLLH